MTEHNGSLTEIDQQAHDSFVRSWSRREARLERRDRFRTVILTFLVVLSLSALALALFALGAR